MTQNHIFQVETWRKYRSQEKKTLLPTRFQMGRFCDPVKFPGQCTPSIFWKGFFLSIPALLCPSFSTQNLKDFSPALLSQFCVIFFALIISAGATTTRKFNLRHSPFCCFKFYKCGYFGDYLWVDRLVILPSLFCCGSYISLCCLILWKKFQDKRD